MLKTAVVEYHVHHHLEAVAVRLVSQPPIFLVGTKAWVHLVIVGGGITVVGAESVVVWRVVLQHRSEPQGRYPQFIEIVEMLADALKVTAMPQTGFKAVVDIRV